MRKKNKKLWPLLSLRGRPILSAVLGLVFLAGVIFLVFIVAQPADQTLYSSAGSSAKNPEIHLGELSPKGLFGGLVIPASCSGGSCVYPDAECSTDADCAVSCPAGQTDPHNSCSGPSCVPVAGCGSSSCASNADCALPPVCTPGAFDPVNCQSCLSDGSGWSGSCTNYGSGSPLSEWCSCELRCTGTNTNPACIQPVCVPNVGNACTSSPNSCGQTNTGIIQCDGSCSATTPPNSSCGLVCTPGAFDPVNCRACFGDGSGWSGSCTNYGSGSPLSEWCGCELKCTGTNTNPQCLATCQDPAATNFGGPLPCTYPPGAPSCTLTFTPSSGSTGSDFTVSWSSVNDADDILPVVCTGSWGALTFSPASGGSGAARIPVDSQTCTATAQNASGATATCNASVTVEVSCPSGQTDPHNSCSGSSCVAVAGCGFTSCSSNADCGAPPTITLNPGLIAVGGSATLTWTAAGATSCTASANPATAQWQGSVSVAGGSKAVSPPQTTTYTITCNTGTASATLKVGKIIEVAP